MNIEKKNSMSFYEQGVKLETKSDEKYFYFSGLAASFSKTPDFYGDIIIKGAFEKTIRERMPAKKIKLLAYHDDTKVIGLPVTLQETDAGLWLEGQIPLTKTEIIDDIKDGLLDGLSIGFTTIKSHREGDLRIIEEAKLYEVSVVPFPAMEDARIFQFKSMFDRVIDKIYSEKNEDAIDELTSLLNDFKLNINKEDKEGRVLSNANLVALKNIVKSIEESFTKLQAIISSAEPDNSDEKSESISTNDNINTEEKETDFEGLGTQLSLLLKNLQEVK